MLHCRSCFQCLFCLMAGVSTSSAWNRKRSERVFWHSQTCTRPRQEKIDAIVHFPQSREGNGALNPRPTMFVRGIPKVFVFAVFLCETFLLVPVIFLSYPLCHVTAQYCNLNRFPPVSSFRHTFPHTAFFSSPPDFASPLG